MNRRIALLVGSAILVAGGWALVLTGDTPKKPVRPPFSGVRGVVEGARFLIEATPGSAPVTISARRVVLRDGKVLGGVFTTPLKQVVNLVEPRVHMGGLTGAEVEARAGRFDPSGSTVALAPDAVIKVGEWSLETEKVLVDASGHMRLPGPFAGWRGPGTGVKGKAFNGSPAELEQLLPTLPATTSQPRGETRRPVVVPPHLGGGGH